MTIMNATVKNVMTAEVVAVRRDTTFKARHVPGVVAVRDSLSYPDDYPVVAGPVF
jgi:hypothetical protein